MPVSSSSSDGESSSNFGAAWWMTRRSFASTGPRSSIGRPSTSITRPSTAGTDGHLDAVAGAADLHAAPQAVGGAHRDRAHDAVAELLLDFERQALLGQRIVAFLDDQRVVDLRQRLARELDIDDRADALDDGALDLCHVRFLD